MYIINQHGIFHSVADNYQLRPGQRKATGEEIAANVPSAAPVKAKPKAEITETVVVVGGKPAKPKAVKND